MIAQTIFKAAGCFAFLTIEITTIPTAPVKFNNWYRYPLAEMNLQLTNTYASKIANVPYHPTISAIFFLFNIF